MAINYSYPNIGSLTVDDKFLVVDVSENNVTKLASINSIVNLVSKNTLQEVLDTGNTATQDINLTGEITATDVITTSLIVNRDALIIGNINVTGSLIATQGVSAQYGIFNINSGAWPAVAATSTKNDGGGIRLGTNTYAGSNAGTDFAVRIGGNGSFYNKFTVDIDGNSVSTGTVTSPTFLGDLNGTINTATTGVTQTAGDNSTKIATTAYADAAAAAVPIPTNNNQLTNGAGYTTNTGTVEGAGAANRLAMWANSKSLVSSPIIKSAVGVEIIEDTKIMGDLTIGEVGTPGDLKLPTSGSNIDVGTNTITGSDNSIALGTGNIVNAAYAIATGQSNEITGNESIAAGFGNTVIGIQSQAFGIENTAEGVQSTAFGNNTTASGPRAFSTGFGTTASGTDSTVHGNNNEAGGTNSFVTGANSTVTGFNSASIGNNLNVTGSASLAVGVWNLDTGFYKFQVGVGTGEVSRKNAFSVTGTGTIIAHVLAESPSYTNDSQAAVGGVPIGGLYRHGNIVHIRIN